MTITAREIAGDLQTMGKIGTTINNWNSAQTAGQKLTQIASIAGLFGG